MPGGPKRLLAEERPAPLRLDVFGKGGEAEGRWFIQVQESLRHHPGGVGGVEARHTEERAGRPLTEELDRLLGDERSMRQLLAGRERDYLSEIETRSLDRVHHRVFEAHRLVPDVGCGRQANADPIDLFRRLSAHPCPVRVVIAPRFVRDFQMIEPIGRVDLLVAAVGVWEEMELANVGARVAVVPQQPRKRDYALRDGHAIVQNTHRRRILPREKTRAARRGDGALHEAVIEVGSISRQSIQVRCLDVRIPIAAQGVPALLIRQYQENVGPSHNLSAP